MDELDPLRAEELVLATRASCARDRAAFEQLIRRTARMLYARIYLDTNDAHRAEDLVQETYLHAWRSIDTLSDPRTFRGWLWSIATRVANDAAKHGNRKKRAGIASDSALSSLVDDRSPSPQESADTREQRDRVLAALRELPEEYRDVLALRYLAGADYDAIGQQLAISNGSLRGLLHRAMKLLREKLEQPERRSHEHR